jgi:hypothetical protein
MDNRLNNFGFNDAPEEPQESPIKVDLKKNERLMKITLEVPDHDGLLDDELPEEFVGEAFIETNIAVREREFETFVKVLHYNKIRYRVETLC